MTVAKIRVLIADDHAIVRSGVKRLLSEVPDIEAVGEVQDAAQILQRMRSEHWDVLLLDLDMPGQNPLDVLRLLTRNHPHVKVLILSMYSEEQFGLRTIKAGAAGYLSKKSAPEQLITAIRRVSEGGAYLSASLAAVLASKLHLNPTDTIHEMLSDREFAVLQGIASGKSITEIAQELSISVKTVSTYRSRLLVTLNLRSNVEVARYAADHGLVK